MKERNESEELIRKGNGGPLLAYGQVRGTRGSIAAVNYVQWQVGGTGGGKRRSCIRGNFFPGSF